MNNLEQMKKRKNKVSAIIAILIVLNLLILLIFASDLSDGDVPTVVSSEETPVEVEGNAEIADIKTGANFTVALDSNGNVWAWGQNNQGQLGNGTITDSLSKTAVLLEQVDEKGNHLQLSNVKQIAVGEYHSAALTENKEVYVWGYNYFGQTGNEAIKKELYPRKVSIPSGETVKQIQSGADFTLILTESGKVFGLGDSSDGQLGYYNDLSFTSIREIEELKDTKELPSIKEISAGYNHVVAVGNDNTVWTWGDTSGSGFEFTTINQIESPEGITPIQVQAGNGVSMALYSDGSVYTWNLGGTPTKVTLPVLPKEDGEEEEKFVQVRTDDTKRNIGIVNKTFYIIDTNDNVYSWGQNTVGQAGIGSNSTTVATLTKLKTNPEATINEKIVKVASSAVAGVSVTGATSANGAYDTAYAINEDGYVLGWGYAGTDITDPTYTKGSNNGKLLGDGTRNVADYIGSVSVKSITGNDIVLKVSETKDLIQMLKDGGYITGGRLNLYREETVKIQDSITIKTVNENIASYDETSGLVKGENIGKTVAEVKSTKNTIYISIEVIDEELVFPKIETRNNYTIALKADGTVWAWGYNSYLGIIDNKHTNHSGIIVPTQVPGLENVKDIAVGNDFVLALMEDGTVLSWGYNYYGQLGDGTTQSTNNTSILEAEPNFAKVQTLKNIVEISAGSNYAMALDENGAVWSWGYNYYGQLGIGTTSYAESLAKQVDLSNLVDADGNTEVIKQIEAGNLASFILTESGDVYACGYNGNYLCGNQKTSTYIPVKINEISKITKISTSVYSNGYPVAISVNGNVWVWGYYSWRYSNGYPRIVNGLEGVIDVEATDDNGAIFSFADGTIGYSTDIYAGTVTPTKFTELDGTTLFKDAMIINGEKGYYAVAKVDGSVWTTGTSSSTYGRLGNRTTNSTALPKLVDISKEYITLDKHEITLEEGQTETISAKYNYGFNLFYDEEEQTMEYTSLDEDITEVNGNEITAVKSGKTYVEATAPTGEVLRVTVNVLSAEETAMPKVSVGYDHTIALKADGSVWGFGYNHYGEIGSTTGKIGEPEKLGISGIQDVAAGQYYSLMLKADGKVLAMGYNGYGQLGNNSTTNSKTPVTVQKQVVDADGNITYVDLDNIVKVSSLGYTSFALDKDGNMYAWGYGANYYATKVDTYGLKVKEIDGKLILTEDGRVWTYESATAIKFVDGLNNIVKISSSAYSNSTSYGYFMALDGNGNVYTWIKHNYDRVTGTETTIPTVQTIDSNIEVVDIEAGVGVAYVIDRNGDIYSWGNNASAGTLGLGTSVSSSVTPVKIDSLSNTESIATQKCSTSYRRTYAVATKGSVYGFGYNGSHSLLGNGETTNYYYEPKLVGESYAGFTINGEPVTRLYMNKGEAVDLQASLLDAFNLRLQTAETSIATDFKWSIFNSDLVSLENTTGTDNKLTANNIIGEAIVVATDSKTGKTAKLYIDVKYNDTEVAPKIESTGDHTVALKADGTVWVWGNNNYGELGILQTGNIQEPKQAKIAEKVAVAEPTAKLDADGVQITDADGKAIYVDTEGNEYYKSGNDYTDLLGTLAIKLDTSNSTFFAWDNQENNYALEDLTDASGEKIIVTDIATSNNHTLMLTKDGNVYSCGDNNNYQLGYSTPTRYQYLPKKVDGLKDIVKIAVGDRYSLALDKYGRLWAFGYVYVYERGRYYYPINSQVPTRITTIANVDMSEYISNAIDITNEYILTKDGEVISLNVSVSSNSYMLAGTKIEGITGKVIKITRTATPGSAHTAFLTDDGKVYAIGKGTYGQLGNEAFKDSVSTTGNRYTAVVAKNTENEALDNIRDIYTGESHTIAIAKDGSVYTWGNNANGELRSSQVQTGVNLARAYKVKDDSRIEDAILVSAGNGYSIVVDETGFAYAWGLGTSGQLGNELGVSSIDARRVGTEGIRLDKNHVTLQENGTPIEVNSYNKQLNLIYNPTMDIDNAISTDESIAKASKEKTSTIKIEPKKQGTTSAVVSSTGSDGEEFINIIQITVLPKDAEIADDVTIPADRTITPMTASGNSHTLILKSDGTVLAYGDNTYGQTASGSKYSDKVTEVKFPAGTPAIVGVTAGDNFSMALDKNGNVYAWGYNENGELGLGSTYNVSTPTRIKSLSNIVKIVAGANHSLALDKNGYVYTWGKNTSGSLGTGANSSITTPRRVNNVASVIDIAAGQDHSMVLTTDGKVYTTGKNEFGQLGAENIISRLNFERVNIEKPIEYIEAGNRTSIAIDIEGNLWVWGENSDGQLGLGIDDRKVYAPTKANISSVESASAGLNHIQVVTTSKELYIAGSNNYGQLGVGSSIDKSNTFRKVSKLGNNVILSDAGTTYSTAIDKFGAVYGFGDYNHGNLDRASLTKSFEPVMLSDNTSYIEEQEVTVKLNETYKINANGKYKINVLHKDDSAFTYESANEDIATIDAEGVITGLDIGTTMIRAVDDDGKASAIIVKVLPVDSIQSPTVEGGKDFAVVTDKLGTAYIFGQKENIIDSNIPKAKNNSVSLKTVKAGDDFIVAINNDGTVWAMGDNSKGQLGEEGIDSSEQIIRLNTNNIKNATQIDAGSNHCIALDNQGVVYVWGDNSNGQLGINKSTTKVEIPTIIRPTTTRIVSVSAGGNYSAIVDSVGEVYILKAGSASKVSGISGAVKVVTGANRTMVLTNEGAVYIVDNETLVSSQKGNKDFVDIATNNETFMMLAKDKTLYAFGKGSNGEYGSGIKADSNTVRETAKDVFTIGGGNTNTYYINTLGEVFATGLNEKGQLGNGTNKSSTTYTKVGNREFSIKELKKDGTEKTVKSTRIGEDWTIFAGGETVKDLVGSQDKTRVMLIKEDGEFNAFGNVIGSINDYEFSLTDTNIAELDTSDKTKAEIIAKAQGETILKVANAATSKPKELKIIIVDDRLLRIEDMYVIDNANNTFEADVDEASDFVINTEGSKETGKLEISLEFEEDTLQAFDSNGNALTVTKDETTGKWTISGLDLTKITQDITLKITSGNGEEFEYTVTIRKEVIVKVNSETLAPRKDDSYIKFVNPEDEKAEIEVTILDNTQKIQLKDEEGNLIATSGTGANILNEEVEIPNKENVFTIEILDSKENVLRNSKLTIYRYSLESISVEDIINVPKDVLANKTEGTDGYVDEYYIEIDETNDPAEVTLNLINKNVQSISIDGVVDTSFVEGADTHTFTTEKNNEDIEIELTVLDAGTNTTYKELYKLRIHKVSSNTEVEKIELVSMGGNSVTLIDGNEFTVSKREADTYEIVLHDKDIELSGTGFEIKVTLKDNNAGVKFNTGKYQVSGYTFTLFNYHTTDNKVPFDMYVMAENGRDVKQYNVVIYKESEDAGIDRITAKSPLDNGTYLEKEAERTEGTDNYVAKVIKDKNEYKVVIELNNKYATIEKIGIKSPETGEVEATDLLREESHVNAEYTYVVNKDMIGKTITIITKAEHGEQEEYTLTIGELDNNAGFDSVKVGDINVDLTNDPLDETKIKALDSDKLTVTAENENATVEIFDVDPSLNSGATPIATGTKTAEAELELAQGQTKTVYMKITSEDGQNAQIKALTVKRMSNNAELEAIVFAGKDGNNITVPYVEGKDVEVAESKIDTPTNVKVVTKDSASATVDGVENSIGADIDLFTKDTITVEVTSEDGTVTKTYEVKVKVLSADTGIDNMEIQDENGATIADKTNFVPDGVDKYKVELKGAGTVDLVITPADEKTKVEFTTSTNSTPVEGNKLQLDGSTTTEVYVKLTAEDGTEKTYTIVVYPATPMLKTVNVKGTNASNTVIDTGRDLTADEINKSFAEVRVHPDSKKAKIALTADTAHTPVQIKVIVNKGQKDDDGNDLEKVITETSLNSSRTVDLDLLDGEITPVTIEMTTKGGINDTLILDIVRGSIEAELEKAIATGTTTKDSAEVNYDGSYSKNIQIASEDELYNITAKTANNGTYKIYKISDANKDTLLNNINLASETLITDETEILLDNDKYQRFVIEVTAEYKNLTTNVLDKARYDLYVKKISNNADLKDFTVTVDGDVEKHLKDFGKFDSNNSIDIIVPKAVQNINIKDLILDNDFAKARWTDVTDKDLNNITDSDYSEYEGENELDYLSLPADLIDPYTVKHVYVEVEAESGTTKVYTLNIKKAEDDTTLTSTTLHDETLDKDVINTNKKSDTAKITEETIDAKVTSKANELVSIKVTKVNGFDINEEIETSSSVRKENSLDINFNTNYTYTDESGATKTIAAADVQEVIVETTVTSIGYALYPTYYTEPAVTKYELKISRLIVDKNIVIEILNEDGTTTLIDTKTTEFTAKEEGEDIIYEYSYKVPSTYSDSLVINNVKAYNVNANIAHGLNSGSDLYTEEEPYIGTFLPKEKDKSSVTERFEVTDPLGNSKTYRLKVVKKSANDDIGNVKVNNTYEAKVNPNATDELNGIVLSASKDKPVNKLNIEIPKVEENAKVEICITGINGKTVTIPAEAGVETDTENGLKTVSIDLMEQLETALAKANVDEADIKNITVSIKVQPEDEELDTREYTLNIDIIEANLLSINGLKVDGTVDESAQLTADDFSAIAINVFETEEIAVPNATTTIDLSKITCTNEGDGHNITITDGQGHDITAIRSLTVYDIPAKVVINVKVDAIEQQYIINIRKKSTDTTIKTVTADENTQDTADENGIYVISIKDTVDPDVKITLTNSNAKVIDVKPVLENVTVSDIENNEFNVSGIMASTHNTAEDTNSDGKTIDLTVTVEAEDGNTKDYTIRLERKHTETGLEEIEYIGDNSEVEVVSYEGKSTNTVTIASKTTGITIKSATTVCENATVFVKYTDDEEEVIEELDATKQYDIPDGTTKTFKIVVKPEYENGLAKEYTLNVKRKSSDTGITAIQANTITRSENDATKDEEVENLYKASINVDEDPRIVVSTTNTAAKVANVKVYKLVDGDLSGVTVGTISNNAFTIFGLSSSLYTGDETEHTNTDNREITVEFDIIAEDTDVSKTYKLVLTREHIETGIEEISYKYAEDGTSTTRAVTLNATTLKEEVKVNAVVESVTFDKILPKCDKAEVSIKVDGEEITQTDDGFSVDLAEEVIGDGCVKTVTITVKAEAGNEDTYTITVIRMASNASLNKVTVNGTDAVREESTEEDIEAIFKADVKDSDVKATIEAISANLGATVSITDVNYTTKDNNKTYDEIGTYNLSGATTREVELLIVVTPEDSSETAKTYKLILTRRYNSTELEQIKIKPEVDGVTDKPFVLSHKVGFTPKGDTHYGYRYNEQGGVIGSYVTASYSWYQTEVIIIPTAWSQISLGDILPELPAMETKITRVTLPDINNTEHVLCNMKTHPEGEYEIDSVFDMPEGEYVYFKVETTAESGSVSNPYIIALYKKATSTKCDITVDGNKAKLDEETGIYKVDVDANKNKLPIIVTGENKLSKDNTSIKVTVNGEDVTTILGTTRSGNENIVEFNLNDILALEYTEEDADGKVITATISVVPEDTTIEPKEYTVEITRRHTSTEITGIVINEGETVTIDGIDDPVSIEQIEDGTFDKNNTKEIKVTSQKDTVTINDIALECNEAVKVITVDGVEQELPFTISLPNEGDTKTIEVRITSEFENTKETPKSVTKYITITRKSSDTTFSSAKIEREYPETSIDSYGDEYETGRLLKDREQALVFDEANNSSANIKQDQNTTILTLYATNKEARITDVEVSDILDRDGNSVKVGNELKGLKLVSYDLPNTKVATIDTTTGRTFVIKVKVQAEDTLVPEKEYTITLTKQDDSALIGKVIGNEENVAIDEQVPHYEYVGKKVLDKDIYTQYIDEGITEVNAEIYAESKFATVEIYDDDPRTNPDATLLASGTNGLAEYTVPTTDEWTKVFVKITAEDGMTTKYYQVWFVKKSPDDDVSIEELYVDGELIPIAEDGNYYIEIPDSITKIEATLIPNYKYANASINGQPYKWQQTTEIVDNLDKAVLVDGKVRIELRVQIPPEQSSTGENVVSKKYLFIERVSEENGIEEIKTENAQDGISGAPYHSEKWDTDTYDILLAATGYIRQEIDLTIKPVSPKAKVELFDLDGNLIQAEEEGELTVYGLEIATDSITTYKVKVTPQRGEAKEYYIDITPKSSQAALKVLTIGGKDIPLEAGKYEYPLYKILGSSDLTGIGEVYALATANSVYEEDNEFGSATVKIYTKENPEGSGEQITGEASLNNIDLDNTVCVTIAVESPDKTNTKTYYIWLQDVSDDNSLQKVSYTNDKGKEIEVTPKPSSDENYVAEYEIVLAPEENGSNIPIIIEATDELARINIDDEGYSTTSVSEITRTVENDDIVVDIVVRAESGNEAKYKLTIKKTTIITGKVITESISKDFSGIEVKLENTEGEEVITTTTETDGTFSEELPVGNYNMIIEEPGYLSYTVTDIPVNYGVRTFVVNAHLNAGDVDGSGEIDLVDLTKVNIKARKNIDSTNSGYIPEYDLNGDGIIDSKDVKILTNNYNKVATNIEYTRVVGLIGEVLDALNGDAIIPNARIEIREKAITDAQGEFEFENVPCSTYMLTVTDESGNVLGSEEITIEEGLAYEIENNTITINPNTSLVDITVRVNGTRAIISKRGEESNQDITKPVINKLDAEVTTSGFKFTVEASDANLESVTFYDKDKNVIATETIASGVAKATVVKEYNKATTFNTEYTFYVEVKDKGGNIETQEIKVTDNIIKTEDDFIKFSKLVNEGKTYEDETVTLNMKSSKDLDLTNNSELRPIGNTSSTPFKGTFDGAGHTITINMNVETVNSGLFGNTDGATIKNVGVKGKIESNKNYVGALVGVANNTTIENCYNSATVTTSTTGAGGLVGKAIGTLTIRNSYNTGDITGGNNVAGIVGRLEATDATIENCYNIGTIIGINNTTNTGEIVGYRQPKTDNVTNEILIGNVNNCYYLEQNPIGCTGTFKDNETYKGINNVTYKIEDTESLLSGLGEEFAEDIYELNNSYPVLKWQNDNLATVVTYSMRKSSVMEISEVELPVSSEYTITSEFGTRVHPVTGEVSKMHYGIDIAADWQSEVLAIADGTVVYAGENGGYGYCIEIEHVINGEKVYSFYAHLYKIDVAVGDAVTKGQTIALVGGVPGTQGAGTSTGPHLHLEIRKQSGSYSSAVDPRNYLEF